MLVRNWMSKPVITIDSSDSMQEAINMLKQKNIHMLPVMRKGRLTGILTDGDLKRASASDATSLDIHELIYLVSKIRVKDIMTREVITVPFDYTVEETADLLLKQKISGVPVVDHDQELMGVITQSDLFRVIISLSGLRKRDIQFGFQVKDQPGTVGAVADIIREYGGRVVSILTSYGEAPGGYRKVYIRAYRIDTSRLEKLTDVLREKTTLLYMVDHRANTRHTYE